MTTKVTTNCGCCGVGRMEARIGMVCCDFCGSIVHTFEWVENFKDLKDGEMFLWASDHWGEEKARRKSNRIAERTGPLAKVVPLRALRKAHARRKKEWKSFGSEYPGELGIVEER